MDSTLHYTSVTHADAMMTSINKMRLNSDLCDVTVIIGNFRIMAHRLILSASAPFFYQTLQDQETSSSSSELHLHDVDITAALKIIEFCYTSAISLDEDTVWQLLVAACKFKLGEVASICCEFLASELTVSSCLHTYKMAHRLNCSKLCTAAQQFLEENKDMVLKDSSIPAMSCEDMKETILSLMPTHSSFVKRLLTVWINQDTKAKQGTFREILDAFPKLKNQLSHLSVKEHSSEEEKRMVSAGNGTFSDASKNQGQTTFEREDSEDYENETQIPLHICVSCGDAFDTPVDLGEHQKCCEESAHPLLQAREVTGKSEKGDNSVVNECIPTGDLSAKKDAVLAGPDETVSDDSGILENSLSGVDRLSQSVDTENSLPHSKVAKANVEEAGHEDEPGECVPPLSRHSLPPSSSLWSHSELEAGEIDHSSKHNDINGNVPEKDCDDEMIDVVSRDDVNEDRKDLSPGSAKAFCDPMFLSREEVEPSSQPDLLFNHKCQICSLSFTDRKSLAKHWKQTHGVDQGMGRVSHQFDSDEGRAMSSLYINGKEDSDMRVKVKKEAVDDEDGEVDDSFGGRDRDGGGGTGDGSRFPPLALGLGPDAETSSNSEVNKASLDLFARYIQQYQEFTQWCLDQGPTFCPLCLLYHPRGTVCPKSGLGAVPSDRDTTKSTSSSLEGQDMRKSDMGSNNKLDQYKSEAPDMDGPLDMSKGSSSSSSTSGFPSAGLVNQTGAFGDLVTSTKSSSTPSALDLSQYYNNYARLMVGSVADNRTATEFVRPAGDGIPTMYNPFMPYQPPGSYSSMSLGADGASAGQKTGQSSGPSDPGSPSGQLPDPRMPGVKRREPSVPGSAMSRSRLSKQGFPCTVCNRVFSYQAALFRHIRTHSPSHARTYQCQLCNETFARAPDLKVHVCPNGIEKPYVCPSCGQTFAKNIHLKRHLATHSGLKPYPCWICGKRFSRSDHLKRHTQSIHAGSRPHVCQTCGKEFVRKYELNKHMLVHTIPSTVPPPPTPPVETATQ